jgi:hypothetical protein
VVEVVENEKARLAPDCYTPKEGEKDTESSEPFLDIASHVKIDGT